ncbi:MAG: hypothetical protein E6R03_16835 [Hyphomicrobiaceae bacterium]|nr:MAG: hypothetical protein E6R03_16835 [Hyphomicrobiaceae bacterium]
MKALPIEVVYFNEGEVYKSTDQFGLKDNYAPDAEADSIFPFRKMDGKRYLFTEEFKQYFGDTGIPATSLQGIDLCPAVDLWICLGASTPEERTNFDVFFAINSVAQLQEVATYYGLPFPATADVAHLIDSQPETIQFWNVGGRPIVPGGVKFIDGVPSILKLYTYPRTHGSWDVWMYGASYFDYGQCWESGAVFQKYTGGADLEGAQMRGSNSFRKAERILSQRADGTRVSYEYTRGAEDRDPAMFWKGVETLPNGQPGQTKRYESSQTVRRALYRMKSGTTLDNKDLCPAVGIWLGRSYYDDSSEEELFFCIQSREMLDQVAEYYGLPVPYSEEQKAVLDSNLQLYRARHYDLLGLGEGNAVPVVVGAVVVQNGAPVRLLMYTFLRQWEFAEQIELPWISDLLY